MDGHAEHHRDGNAQQDTAESATHPATTRDVTQDHPESATHPATTRDVTQDHPDVPSTLGLCPRDQDASDDGEQTAEKPRTEECHGDLLLNVSPVGQETASNIALSQ